MNYRRETGDGRRETGVSVNSVSSGSCTEAARRLRRHRCVHETICPLHRYDAVLRRRTFGLLLMLGACATSVRVVGAQVCPIGRPIAFVNASVLSMDTPTLLRAATVVVEGGLIASINPTSVPANACQIDAAGGVLMPGLADMHVHTDSTELPIFLANGVTTVREMNGSPAMVAVRERIRRGELLGPRLLVASPLMVGAPLRFRHTLIVTAEDARKAAAASKAIGYDYLKIYDGLTREAYDAFVESGKSLGLPLDGHIPADVGLARVLEAGQSLQHIDKIAFAIGGHRGDTSQLAATRQLLKGRRVWFTPTLASVLALDASGTTEYGTLLRRADMAWVDDGTMAWWRSLAGERVPRPRSPMFQVELLLLGVLRESGARFLLGTDAGNPTMVPGFSVHEEMAALVREGGFTPFEVLKSATRNVGEFLNDSLRGRLVPGANADLLLVRRNPLDDLSTLRTPLGVMVRGRWLTRADLDGMLEKTKRR